MSSKGKRQLPRVPRMRGITIAPRGSVGVPINTKPVSTGGPGDPPESFLGPRNSKTEWPIYWALAKIFGVPTDPRKPPFDGGFPYWTYQVYSAGIGLAPANVDFVINMEDGNPIAIKVQTEFYHLFSSNAEQVFDDDQDRRLEESYDVVRIYDYQYMDDPTGQAAVIVCKNALGLIQQGDPIRAGTSRRARIHG